MECQKAGEKWTVSSFMICTTQRILLGTANQGHEACMEIVNEYKILVVNTENKRPLRN
jgi:hypothetical protein